MSTPLLNVDGLEVRYGEIRALQNVSFTVNDSEVVSVIGANGAGKSTLLRTISGLVRPTKGRIQFRDQDISSRRPDQIVGEGIIHCPEGRAVLRRMTVVENLELGAFRWSRNADVADDLDRVFALFPRLAERRNQLANTLSGGEQQMLAIGRALMARPTLMMIDEPSLGLAPVLVTEVFRVINQLARSGLTVLLVEQHARQALKSADRAYVLETGHVAIEGPAEELISDPQVQAAYLGKGSV